MHCGLDLLTDNARKCKGQPVAEQWPIDMDLS